MVFSRYVTVLRGAGKTLRCSLLDTKVIHERLLIQTTAKFRTCKIQEKEQTDNRSSTKNNLTNPIIISNDVSNYTPKVVESSSRASTTEFDLPSNHERDSNDDFGKDLFMFDDDGSDDSLYESMKLPNALDTCDRDVSDIAPFHSPAFNFAAYADNSPVIQELAKLGVKLYKVERKDKAMEFLLQRNFEDMKPYIQFLHDSGVPADAIGAFITKNPFIFREEMDDLHTRIRYLRAHKFDRESVARIVTLNPFWLMFNTKRIDNRLGFFQREYSLSGPDVRKLATKQPRLITYGFKHLRENTFAVREEMGFTKQEVKNLLMNKPRLFMKMRSKLVDVFDYVHNTMKLPHDILSRQPGILTCRLERLQQRHKFLKIVGKAQYDPTKPLYVSPDSIVVGTDSEFCRNVAKSSVQTYNLFLKTL